VTVATGNIKNVEIVNIQIENRPMKKWALMLIIFILICVIGYMNKNNYQECVEEHTTKCENEMLTNCKVKAKDFCNWTKK